MRRPRCRSIAVWLRYCAWRIYPEALHTIEVTTGDPPQTKRFIDCREWRR